MNPVSLPNKFFVINLIHRSDRLEAFKKATKEFPFEIEVVPAICGDVCNPPPNWTAGNGAWGCYKTHLNILEHCLNSRIGSYMVFEDDAIFKPEFVSVLERTFNNIPSDWDQCYFGGQLMHTNSRIPLKINNHIYRPFNVNRTHCFAVSRAGMGKIYKHISNLPFHPHEHIDHHLGRWHEDMENKVYCPPFWVVGQHGSPSSVSGKNEPVQFYDDPIKFAKDHWLFQNPICILFTGNPNLIQKLLPNLHFGNQITNQGFDVTLSKAMEYAYPLPFITEWYNWIRSECVKEGGSRLPAAYHPSLSQELLERATSSKVIVVSSLEDLKKLEGMPVQ